MDTVMDHEEMRALAKELAKGLKTEQDLTEFTTQLTKMAVDAALGARGRFGRPRSIQSG
jgi:putative transposase